MKSVPGCSGLFQVQQASLTHFEKIHPVIHRLIGIPAAASPRSLHQQTGFCPITGPLLLPKAVARPTDRSHPCPPPFRAGILAWSSEFTASRAPGQHHPSGGARASGSTSRPGSASPRCARIYRIIAGSSMLTATLTAPQHAGQVSMSIGNTNSSHSA